VPDLAQREISFPEHLGQLVHGLTRLVAGDQLLDLVVVESPGAPRSVSLGGCRQEVVEAGKLPAELL
jgi:hypothetical protein